MLKNIPFEGIYISGFSDEISSDFDIQLDVVKKLGMEYISIRGVDGKNIGDFTLEEFKENVEPRLKEKNIKISSIGSPIGKIFIDDEAGFEKQKEILHTLCQIANLVGCKYIRIFSFYINKNENFDEFSDEVLSKLNQFVEIAKKYNIILLHENEKDIYGDTISRCVNMFEKINSKYFQAIFDFANFVQVGENTMEAYTKLEKYIKYYHIKDAVSYDNQNVVCGTGEGQIKEILKNALKKGYNGFLTLEPHLVLFDSLKDLELSDVNDIIKDNKGLDSKEAYALQYNSLIDILEEIKEER